MALAKENATTAPAPGRPVNGAWTPPDRDAHNESERWVALAYSDLMRIAHRFLRNERLDPVLEASALVHEAYLLLRRQRRREWFNKQHFLAIAKRVMQRVLIDHARSRSAQKRGGQARHIESSRLEDSVGTEFQEPILRLLVEKLRESDREAFDVVALKAMRGWSTAETATLLRISTRTVDRRWRRGREWLGERLLSPREEPAAPRPAAPASLGFATP